MFGFGKASPIAEHEAEGEIEQVYHQIRQSLRVTGVNLVFRKWASQPGLLPVIWNAVRPSAETRAFELAADQLRTEAARSVMALGRLGILNHVALGESQAYQVRSALDLYHYINPKLLLLVAMVRRGMEGEAGPSSPRSGSESGMAAERVELGFPGRMYAMEMEDAEPDDERLRGIFADIRETLSLESINSDYRTLALWPDYLNAAWKNLKPMVQRPEYDQAVNLLRELARTLAAGLPCLVSLGREPIEAAGVDFDAAADSAKTFERLLPGLILNVAFCLQDWCEGDELARSPFPAETRTLRSNPH